jgi:hypothetical protein
MLRGNLGSGADNTAPRQWADGSCDVVHLLSPSG